ncbi:MAG TPA: DNA adenine methylase [Verrucomicrobiae bacterium]|nr:DNA adenine methylase [Verrucomicrobiae bacterium]
MSHSLPSREAVSKSLPRAPRPGRALGNNARVEAQPFLKWAGGKSQLLEQFEPFFPESIRGYCEPFLGGGAVFFHLKARFPKMRAQLRDNNAELVNCYQVVRDQVQDLMRRLDAHLAEFRESGESYYYQVRSLNKTDAVDRAARMIFLNKTCYNGLWRVNGSGQFNVPIGSYRPDRVSLYDRGNLLAASAALEDVDIAVQDFRKTLAGAHKDEFVYVDPPYFPLSRTANFTSYTREVFGQSEQEELARLVSDAAARGALLMISNSDTPTTRKLYGEFDLRTVQARRAVNCDGSKRGRISELVVLTYAI